MTAAAVAVYEEQVTDELLHDLARGPREHTTGIAGL